MTKKESTIQDLLKALNEAKANKDKQLQRKLRRQLRAEGYFISKEGFVEEDFMKEREEKAKARKKARKEKKKGEQGQHQETTVDEDIIDFFDIDEDTSWDDIKKQYRNLCKENHPDKGGDEEIMKKINEAYEKLQKQYGK